MPTWTPPATPASVDGGLESMPLTAMALPVNEDALDCSCCECGNEPSASEEVPALPPLTPVDGESLAPPMPMTPVVNEFAAAMPPGELVPVRPTPPPPPPTTRIMMPLVPPLPPPPTLFIIICFSAINNDLSNLSLSGMVVVAAPFPSKHRCNKK